MTGTIGACVGGKLEGVRSALARGGDVNDKDCAGTCPYYSHLPQALLLLLIYNSYL